MVVQAQCSHHRVQRGAPVGKSHGSTGERNTEVDGGLPVLPYVQYMST